MLKVLLAPDLAWVGCVCGGGGGEALMKGVVTARDHTTFLHCPTLCCRSQATEILEQHCPIET